MRKTSTVKVKEVPNATASKETLVIWRAKQPLSDAEHEMIAERLRFEQEKSGVKIMLVPFSVDVEIEEGIQEPAQELVKEPAEEPASNPEQSGDPE